MAIKKNSNTLNRRDFIKASAALGGCTAAYLLLRRLISVERKPNMPNIVFILMDDLGWGDLGCYHNVFYETPSIDRLATQGMRFTQAYAASSVCSPTRASILTGQYPARIGLNSIIPAPAVPPGAKLIPPEVPQQLPLELTTVAEMLKANGYATGFIGKWHLGGRDFFPDRQGFDQMHICGFPSLESKTAMGTQVDEDEHLAESLTEKAEEFIRENKKRPFFIYLAHFLVHVPYSARKQLVEKYAQKQKPGEGFHPVYAAMIEQMDYSVGRIMSLLEETGIADDTVVIFTSDNGGLRGLYEGETYWKNLPHRFNEQGEPVRSFRGGKATLYEGGIRVPLIISWPGRINSGSICRTPVCSIDFYPTLLEIAGIHKKPHQVIDGCNITPLLLQNGGLNRETLYWHYPYYPAKPSGAIRKGNWKLIEFFEDNHVELYDLEQDECETDNQADRNPQLAKELQGMLAKWRRSLKAAMPTINPDYDTQR